MEYATRRIPSVRNRNTRDMKRTNFELTQCEPITCKARMMCKCRCVMPMAGGVHMPVWSEKKTRAVLAWGGTWTRMDNGAS